MGWESGYATKHSTHRSIGANDQALSNALSPGSGVAVTAQHAFLEMEYLKLGGLYHGEFSTQQVVNEYIWEQVDREGAG